MSELFECPRIDDAAAYVLRALPDSEAESYRHHVTQCVECEAKVAELGFVSHALLSAVPQLSAPADIRGRVMSVVRAESELLNAAGAGADRPARAAGSRRLHWGLGRLGPLTSGALAACLIAVGIGAGVVLSGSGDSGQPCTTQRAAVKRPGATGELKVCRGSETLRFAGLVAPQGTGTYQTWFVNPRDPTHPRAGGLFTPHGGSALVDVSDRRPGEIVMVTEEPKGGSEAPSGKVFFQADGRPV